MEVLPRPGLRRIRRPGWGWGDEGGVVMLLRQEGWFRTCWGSGEKHNQDVNIITRGSWWRTPNKQPTHIEIINLTNNPSVSTSLLFYLIGFTRRDAFWGWSLETSLPASVGCKFVNFWWVPPPLIFKISGRNKFLFAAMPWLHLH